MPVILNGLAQLVSNFEVSISVYILDYLGVVSPLGVDAFYWLKFLMSTWQYNVELKELRLDVQITFQTLFSNKAQHLCPSHQYQNGIMDTQQQVNNLKVRTNPKYYYLNRIHLFVLFSLLHFRPWYDLCFFWKKCQRAKNDITSF
jgi:hypothetical protein